jgi:hypothetical protein
MAEKMMQPLGEPKVACTPQKEQYRSLEGICAEEIDLPSSTSKILVKSSITATEEKNVGTP